MTTPQFNNLISCSYDLSSFDQTSSLDPDIHLSMQSNFKYYSADDFKNNIEIANCLGDKHFSAMHYNIRSLNANF